LSERELIPIHFAHANGFPAASYQQLFHALPPHFKVHALSQFGHNPTYPVNNNLARLVDELLDYVRQLKTGPIYAVGHSMGALLSYMAACEQPELFKGVIMLAPPIASGLPGVLFRLAKYSPLIDKISPAGKAATRCKSWALDTDLLEYFSGKTLFKNFHPACIADYVSAAIAIQDGKQVLRFDADIEAQIFRNVPHNIHQYYGRMQRPSCLITAQKSQVCTPRFLKSFKRATHIDHTEVPELGHMFPLEAPSLVAQLIQQKIAEWEKNQ